MCNWKKKEKMLKKKMGTNISHDACKLSWPPRLLKKKGSPVIGKKCKGKAHF